METDLLKKCYALLAPVLDERRLRLYVGEERVLMSGVYFWNKFSIRSNPAFISVRRLATSERTSYISSFVAVVLNPSLILSARFSIAMFVFAICIQA